MNRIVKKYMLPLMLITVAIPSFGANESTVSAGMSDSTLLGLMLGIILVLLIIISFLTGMIKNIATGKDIWETNKNNNTAAGAGVVVLMLSSFDVWAQGGDAAPYVMSNTTFWLLMSIIIILTAIAFQLLATVRKMVKKLAGTTEVETQAEVFGIKLTDAVDIEHERDILLDHDYDGIKELDNNLPPWWLYMFYISIVFAIVYFTKWHILGDGDIMHRQFVEQMEEGEAQVAAYMEKAGNLIDETNVEALTDAGAIEEGKAIYEKNCVACHGAAGEGGVGPNLTDDYWLHGGGIKNIFKTIKNGVPEKGMISWKTQLKPAEIQKVASYILTLHGTNPAGAKPPQGDLWEE